MTEKISSILDNEINGKDLELAIDELSKNSNSLSSFKAYQTIGDVIRNDYYAVNPNLSSDIMKNINDEPIQFNNGFLNVNKSTISFDYQKYAFVFLSGLIVAFIITWIAGIFSQSSAPVGNEFLASDNVTLEIIEDHFSTTSPNPNYYLEAGYQSNI
jgi:hypothetical protein